MSSSSEASSEDRPSKRCRHRCTRSDDPKNCHFELWWAPEGEENPYADWSIVVESKTKTRSFTVHQKVLEYKSNYFASIFQGNFIENSNKCSHFEFDDTIVERFDRFLDCLYAFDYLNSKEFNQYYKNADSHHNGVVLMYLLDYFRVEVLLDKGYGKIFRHLSSRDILAYLRFLNSLPFQFPNFAEAAIVLSSDDFDGNVDVRCCIFKEAPLDFLLDLFRHECWKSTKSEQYDIYWNWLSEHRRHQIDLNAFIGFVSSDVLQILTTKVSMELLKLASTYSKSVLDSKMYDALFDFETRCNSFIGSATHSSSLSNAESFLQTCKEFEGANFSQGTRTAIGQAKKDCSHRIAKHLISGLTLYELSDYMDRHSFLYDHHSRMLLLQSVAEIGRLAKIEPSEEILGSTDFIATHLIPILKKAKAIKAHTVPLHVAGAGLYYGGKYERIDDGLYQHAFFNSLSIVRDGDGAWIISDERCGPPVFTSSAIPEYKGCPPFSGWEDNRTTRKKYSLNIMF